MLRTGRRLCKMIHWSLSPVPFRHYFQSCFQCTLWLFSKLPGPNGGNISNNLFSFQVEWKPARLPTEPSRSWCLAALFAYWEYLEREQIMAKNLLLMHGNGGVWAPVDELASIWKSNPRPNIFADKEVFIYRDHLSTRSVNGKTVKPSQLGLSFL